MYKIMFFFLLFTKPYYMHIYKFRFLEEDVAVGCRRVGVFGWWVELGAP